MGLAIYVFTASAAAVGSRSLILRLVRPHSATFYLETFNFQTPRLDEPLGYTVAYEHKVYPHGIVKYIMVKYDPSEA